MYKCPEDDKKKMKQFFQVLVVFCSFNISSNSNAFKLKTLIKKY